MSKANEKAIEVLKLLLTTPQAQALCMDKEKDRDALVEQYTTLIGFRRSPRGKR